MFAVSAANAAPSFCGGLPTAMSHDEEMPAPDSSKVHAPSWRRAASSCAKALAIARDRRPQSGMAISV